MKYGDPWSQCPVTEDGEFDMKSLYIRGSERRISSIDHVFKVTQRWNAEPRWSSLFVHIRDRHKSTAVFDSHVWIHPEAPAPPVFSLSRVFSLSCVYTGNVLEGKLQCLSLELAPSPKPHGPFKYINVLVLIYCIKIQTDLLQYDAQRERRTC